MRQFVLTSDWSPKADGGGALTLSLLNRSGQPLRDFRLGLTTFFWIGPNDLEGGSLVEDSQCQIVAPPEGYVLAPGGTWTVHGHFGHTFKRYSSVIKSAYLILSGDKTEAVETVPTSCNREPGAPKLTIPPFAVANVGVPVAVIPYPKAVDVSGRREELSRGLQVPDPVAGLVARLFPSESLASDNGIPVNVLLSNRILTKEAYQIHFDPERVMVVAQAREGLHYGLITLCQILRATRLHPDQFLFPTRGVILDEPRLPFRGLLLDVARQVFTVDEILHVVDCMAWNKLNRLHLHLTDDCGWRLDIPRYPQLVERGAQRGHGLLIPPSLGSAAEPYGNVFSASDIRVLLDRAEALGITIIPEIEMPGHSYAILQAMPDLRDPRDGDVGTNLLNPALPKTYEVVGNILDYVAYLFRSPYIHLGCDEVWEGAWTQSPMAKELMAEKGFTETYQVQSHFLKTAQAYVRDTLGRGIGVWEEAAKGGGFDPDRSYVTAWLTSGLDLAKAGYNVVSTPKSKYYLDMTVSPDWWSPGMDPVVTPEICYAYDPSGDWPDEYKSKLMGVQGCLWGEHIHEPKTRPHLMFPRLSAIAETGWTSVANKNFARFIHLCGLMPTFENAPCSLTLTSPGRNGPL
jgi:hexosaminidase